MPCWSKESRWIVLFSFLFACSFVAAGERPFLVFRLADGRKIELATRSDDQSIIYRCSRKGRLQMVYAPEGADSLCGFFVSRYFRPNQNNRDGLDFQYLWFFQSGYRYLIYSLSYELSPCQYGIRIKHMSSGEEVDLPAIGTNPMGNPVDLMYQSKVCQDDTTFD